MLIKPDEVSCNKFMYNYIKVKRHACPCSGSAQSTLMALKCAVITTNVARELVCDTGRVRLWIGSDSHLDQIQKTSARFKTKQGQEYVSGHEYLIS